MKNKKQIIKNDKWEKTKIRKQKMKNKIEKLNMKNIKKRIYKKRIKIKKN